MINKKLNSIKISDCLLLLLHISNGLESYEINNYYSKLIGLGYAEIEGFKYILSDKGKEKMKQIIKESEMNNERS